VLAPPIKWAGEISLARYPFHSAVGMG
jgi:hypothetical protein